jgi:hypothetical protein
VAPRFSIWARALDKSTTLETAITGYTLLAATSIEEAVTLMKDHPHFFMSGSSAQILECVPYPERF